MFHVQILTPTGNRVLRTDDRRVPVTYPSIADARRMAPKGACAVLYACPIGKAKRGDVAAVLAGRR
jgi:hypothetical protein